jgi:hypothetical protein
MVLGGASGTGDLEIRKLIYARYFLQDFRIATGLRYPSQQKFLPSKSSSADL